LEPSVVINIEKDGSSNFLEINPGRDQRKDWFQPKQRMIGEIGCILFFRAAVPMNPWILVRKEIPRKNQLCFERYILFNMITEAGLNYFPFTNSYKNLHMHPYFYLICHTTPGQDSR